VAQVSDAERTIHGSHLGPHGSCSGGSSLAAGCARDASGAAAVAGCARASGASTGNTGGAAAIMRGYDPYDWGYDIMIL